MRRDLTQALFRFLYHEASKSVAFNDGSSSFSYILLGYFNPGELSLKKELLIIKRKHFHYPYSRVMAKRTDLHLLLQKNVSYFYQFGG